MKVRRGCYSRLQLHGMHRILLATCIAVATPLLSACADTIFLVPANMYQRPIQRQEIGTDRMRQQSTQGVGPYGSPAARPAGP